MKKILIIDHFSKAPGETGNNRFIYLAEMLCKSGHEVEVVTSDFQHIAKRTRHIEQQLIDELPYKYSMLSEPVYPKNVCLKRFYSHYVFGQNLRKYLTTIEKPDLVYISVPSLNVGTAAADYCNENNIPLIVDVQDLWPEAFQVVFNVPVLKDVAFAPMMAQAKKTYSAASKILAVSETYKERGLRDCQKDKAGLCVYLGTEMDTFDENRESIPVEKPDDEIWIAYVGTLGHSYNIEIIIDALNQIADKFKQRVVFKVVGNGPYMERFQEYAKDCKVPVDFLGRRIYPEMVAYLSKADIAVNPIVKGAAQSIINKHADYAMAGLPVVNTQECQEYRNLISEYECGINCICESREEVADALLRVINDEKLRQKMGAASRRMAEERFDRKETYKKIINEIERLIEEQR